MSRGTEEGHGIPRDSLSQDRALTSELHENEAGIVSSRQHRQSLGSCFAACVKYIRPFRPS